MQTPGSKHDNDRLFTYIHSNIDYRLTTFALFSCLVLSDGPPLFNLQIDGKSPWTMNLPSNRSVSEVSMYVVGIVINI